MNQAKIQPAGKRHLRAYTLIELMIAMAILAVIASVAYPTYSKIRNDMDIALIEKDFVEIDMAMERYFADYGSFPPSLTVINMQKDDPWGNPYQYLNMALANTGQKRKDQNLVPINTDYDLYSKGPDGMSIAPLSAPVSKDDIIRANNGSYIGPASDY